MLPLTAFLLAASLGEAPPTAFSLEDPPPCAAVNVPGCLPGYKPRIDRFGRLVYVRDPDYVPPLAQAAPLPLAPARWQVAGPPQPSRWVPAAPTVPAAAAEGRGHVGIVVMPGVAAFPSYTRLNETKPQAQIALEFRGTEGGARVRLAGEYTSFGKIGELSFKYDLFEGFFLRPFLGLGLGVASINPDPALRGAGSASAGLDVYLSRDFFLTGEVKERLFTNGTQGPAHGLVTSNRRQTSFLAGMGFYFF